MASMIQTHLGQGWSDLHPRIRQRFANDPAPGETILYKGKIDTQRSRAGWLFAHLTRIIGNPLTPYAGEDIPLEVRLFRDEPAGGICWERTYHFPGRNPYTVKSVKKTGADGEMLECTGGGFGMVLAIHAEDGQLHFLSVRYFWQWRRLRIRLPHCISPGQTHVVHAHIDEHRFRFTISMTHAKLGRTFFQTGIFSRMEE